jgi:hypothetical protein
VGQWGGGGWGGTTSCGALGTRAVWGCPGRQQREREHLNTGPPLLCLLCDGACVFASATCPYVCPSVFPSLRACVRAGVCACGGVNSMGLSLPGLALAHQLYLAVKAQGHGRLGTHSLFLALETLNGIPHEPRK